MEGWHSYNGWHWHQASDYGKDAYFISNGDKQINFYLTISDERGRINLWNDRCKAFKRFYYNGKFYYRDKAGKVNRYCAITMSVPSRIYFEIITDYDMRVERVKEKLALCYPNSMREEDK